MSFRTCIVLLISGVFSAAAFGQSTQPTTQRINLWDKTPDVVAGKDTDTDPTEPTLDIYLPDAGTETGAAMIIFPGGSYTHLSTTREGSDVAKLLVQHQIAAFVLRYRHGPRYQYPIPMEDARRAIRLVRSKAAQFAIDAHRLGVIGFSAGGHLAATVATQFDDGDPNNADPVERQSSRPDFAALLYPVITLSDEPFVHKQSRQSLLGGRTELYAGLSADQRVTPDTPPIFLAHASTDKVVPVQNSVMFFMACKKNGVPAELHIFENGNHGFGLGLPPANPALAVWPQLMLTWMSGNHWLTPTGQ
jgi:acetyl esterase/lipase